MFTFSSIELLPTIVNALKIIYDWCMLEVIKATGEHEPFSEEKLERSIARAGIPKNLRDEVQAHVKTKLYDNIKTSEIYHHIVEFLDKSSEPYSHAKYQLKEAIMRFGPTGYPFEDFIAQVVKAEGYSAEVRSNLQGRCITHEVDVVVEKHTPVSEKAMIEVKFHNQPGNRTDTQVALYTMARFEDLKDHYGFAKPWLVTNTKVTTDVIKYAMCSGMKIMGWSYPEGESLRDLIEKHKLHPITALTALTLSQQQQLLNQHIVLCKEIAENPAFLNELNLPEDHKGKVLAEASFVAKS